MRTCDKNIDFYLVGVYIITNYTSGVFMNTKLTLRLDDVLINRAKEYARREGKSLSQIVTDYFRTVQQPPENTKNRHGPLTMQLHGCLKGTKLTEKDYRQHLERKYS